VRDTAQHPLHGGHELVGANGLVQEFQAGGLRIAQALRRRVSADQEGREGRDQVAQRAHGVKRGAIFEPLAVR